MFDTCVFGCEQGKEQINRQMIHRTEFQWLFQQNENTTNTIKILDTRVRQGHAVSNAGRPKVFAFIKRLDRFQLVNTVNGLANLCDRTQ